MTCGGPHRIDAAILVDETDAGVELVDLGLLLRREFALDADEAPSLLDAGAVALVDVGENARDLLGELVRVDHAIGVGEKRRALDVGREQPAAAIEDVGTMDRRGDVEARPRPVAAKPSVTSRAAIRAKASARRGRQDGSGSGRAREKRVRLGRLRDLVLRSGPRSVAYWASSSADRSILASGQAWVLSPSGALAIETFGFPSGGVDFAAGASGAGAGVSCLRRAGSKSRSVTLSSVTIWTGLAGASFRCFWASRSIRSGG